MDHVARFAIHKEANVRTCWRFCIGFLWKHCCLHISLLKFHLLVLKYQFKHVQGTRVNETLTHEGMMTHSSSRPNYRSETGRPEWSVYGA